MQRAGGEPWRPADDAAPPTGPCQRFPCGVNARCTPSDPPKCLCDAGYSGNPYEGCRDIDECRNSPCAPGASCINEKGNFKCICPPGTKGDPLGSGCTGSATGCASDSDCDGTLACESGQCVNPCQQLPCGANALCEPENHAAWCRCLPGFKRAAESDDCVSGELKRRPSHPLGVVAFLHCFYIHMLIVVTSFLETSS